MRQHLVTSVTMNQLEHCLGKNKRWLSLPSVYTVVSHVVRSLYALPMVLEDFSTTTGICTEPQDDDISRYHAVQPPSTV